MYFMNNPSILNILWTSCLLNVILNVNFKNLKNHLLTFLLVDTNTYVVTCPSNVNRTKRLPHNGMTLITVMLVTWTDTTSTVVPIVSWAPSNWTNKDQDVSDTTLIVAVFPIRNRVIPLKRRSTTTDVVIPSIWTDTMLLAVITMPCHVSVWSAMIRAIKYSTISLVVPWRRLSNVSFFFFNKLTSKTTTVSIKSIY